MTTSGSTTIRGVHLAHSSTSSTTSLPASLAQTQPTGIIGTLTLRRADSRKRKPTADELILVTLLGDPFGVKLPALNGLKLTQKLADQIKAMVIGHLLRMEGLGNAKVVAKDLHIGPICKCTDRKAAINAGDLPNLRKDLERELSLARVVQRGRVIRALRAKIGEAEAHLAVCRECAVLDRKHGFTRHYSQPLLSVAINRSLEDYLRQKPAS